MNTSPVLARLAVSLPAFELNNSSALPADIQWMPPGKHSITAKQGDEVKTLTVEVNQQTAATIERTFQDYLAKAASGQGDTPFFDFNHNDEEASGRPTGFYWGGTDPSTGGVRASMEWTEPGKVAVRGKAYRRFSPSFFVDAAGTVTGAPVNMGGLVNRAAFKSIQPLFASDASESGSFVPPDLDAYPDGNKFIAMMKNLAQVEGATVKSTIQKYKGTYPDLYNGWEKWTAQLAHPFAQQAQSYANQYKISLDDAKRTLQNQLPDLYEEYAKLFMAGAPEQHAFMVQAKALAKQNNVSVMEASVEISAKHPELYSSYCRCVTTYEAPQEQEVEAVQAVEPEHPFIIKAKQLAEIKGIAIADASVELAGTVQGGKLYDAYRNQR